jgi:hypothetical protein
MQPKIQLSRSLLHYRKAHKTLIAFNVSVIDKCQVLTEKYLSQQCII